MCIHEQSCLECAGGVLSAKAVKLLVDVLSQPQAGGVVDEVEGRSGPQDACQMQVATSQYAVFQPE